MEFSTMPRTLRWLAFGVMGAAMLAVGHGVPTAVMAQSKGPAQWQNDLTPIKPSEWNYEFAAHLLERTGFGGTPEEIQALARLTPAEAVRRVVYFQNIDNSRLAPFDHSGVHDPSLEPFPPSRPAVTKMAKETGEALGIKVKPGTDRPLQPKIGRASW